jgi:hypothetical protein
LLLGHETLGAHFRVAFARVHRERDAAALSSQRGVDGSGLRGERRSTLRERAALFAL